MPCKPGLELPRYSQHAIQRGNNRESSFYAQADYQRHWKNLTDAGAKHSRRIHARLAMTNHAHLWV